MKVQYEKTVMPLFGIFGTLVTIIAFIFPEYKNVQISLPLYVATILILLLISSIFIKLYLNIKKHINDNVYFNNFALKPIQFVQKINSLILKRTINIPLSTVVSIYLEEELYESLITIGYVAHVQERIIQIKLLFENKNIYDLLDKNQKMNKIIIRPASNINNIFEMITKGA